MSKYKIVVDYDTGDSFNQYPNQKCECVHTWENLDIAKENLKRIDAHYKAYKEIKGWSSYGKPTWDDYKNEKWHNGKSVDYTLLLLKDDGESYQEYANWLGYFERMNFASIECVEGDDMKIYGH
jgi:hypothetical protein